MLRLIDANLNRASEGLRTLEDVARFVLNDARLSADLKSLRHDLTQEYAPHQKALLSARDSARDVAAFVEQESEARRTGVSDIVTASARRVEESLRVLEEFAKLPDSVLESDRFKRARFALYDLERELTGRLLRQGRRVSGLYVIVDPEALQGRDEVAVAEKAISGGARAVQLRDKRRSKIETLRRANELRALCARYDALFIVNDHLDVALASVADGLHLGHDDFPVSTTRQFLSIDTIVGRTTRTVESALQAERDGADYVAVGSIYPTGSKTDTHVVGLKRLREVKEAVSIPVVAIGGINASNVADVVAAGADSVAVLSAVAGAEDVEGAARRLSGAISSS